MTATAMQARWPKLTAHELASTHLVILEDGRQLSVPSVVYDHVRETGFRHGVRWAKEDSRRAAAYERKCCETPARVIAECRLDKPSTECRHLFGVKVARGKRRGYFLVNTDDRCVDREALREIFAEAKQEGIEGPLHIFCATSLISGPNLDIIQIGCDA